MFANGEREGERERLVQTRQGKPLQSADQQVEGERERCVCVFFLNFVSFFFLLWELVYVFQSFVSIFAKKNLNVRDV